MRCSIAPTKSGRSCVVQRASCNDSARRQWPRGKRLARRTRGTLRARRNAHPMPIDLDDPVALRGQEIRATSPEDFVILKVLATRDRDLEDARSVIETQRARLDLALIRMEIQQLSDEIPDHDIR